MEAGTVVDVDALHAASEIRQVKLAQLRVDRSYQRDPSQKLVDDIAANWDEISSELLLVSDRGDREDPQQSGLWVVNGQHRSLGARKCGLVEVWARVIDLSYAEDPAAVEATFRLRTNVRMSDKPMERFKAQVRAGNEESIAIVKIVSEFGTEMNDTPTSESGINAVSAVEKLYRVDGAGDVLRETLQAIHDIVGTVGGKGTSAPMMLGVAWFILKHGQETDRSRFVERAAMAGNAATDRRARTHQSVMGGPLWFNYYRSFLDFYNENLHEKNKLKYQSGGASVWKSTGKAYTS